MNRQFFKFRGLGVIIALAVIAVFSAVVMVLWNALMPGIFALPVLNYWQALGILVLSRVLFGDPQIYPCGLWSNSLSLR
jgi:uncharacterized membrane-anchored protein